MRTIYYPSPYQKRDLKEILTEIDTTINEIEKTNNSLQREYLDNQLKPLFEKLGRIMYELELK